MSERTRDRSSGGETIFLTGVQDQRRHAKRPIEPDNGTDEHTAPPAPAEEHHELQTVNSGKPDKPKPVRNPPKDVIVPQRLPWSAYYGAWCLVRRPDKGYRRTTAKDKLLQEIELLEAWLRAMANTPGSKFNWSVLNTRGGSTKTSNVIYVGSLIANVTRKAVWVLPASANTATGNAAAIAGVGTAQTLTITEAAALWNQFRNFSMLEDRVATNDYGLRVIANDPANEVGIDKGFSVSDFINVADVLYDNAKVCYFDHGNDNVNHDTIGLEAARRSHLISFVASAAKLDTLYDLSKAIGLYHSDDTRAEQFTATTPESTRFPTQFKTEHGMTVISRIGKKDDPEYFRRYTKLLDDFGDPVGDLGFQGAYLTVPEDPYIADNHPSTLVCSLEDIKRETYRAYAFQAVMGFLKTGKQKGLVLPSPSPKLVDLLRRRDIVLPSLAPNPVDLLPVIHRPEHDALAS